MGLFKGSLNLTDIDVLTKHICVHFFSGDKLQKYSKNKMLSCIDVPRCKTVLHFQIIVIY